MTYARLDKQIEDLIVNIFIKNMKEDEYPYIKSNVINSWKQDNDYIIIFENMRPNCMSYMIDIEEVKKEIRLRKIKNLIK